MRFRKPTLEDEPAPFPQKLIGDFKDPFIGITIDRKALFQPFGYSELAQGYNPSRILTVAEAMRPNVARLAMLGILAPPAEADSSGLPSIDDDVRKHVDQLIPEALIAECDRVVEENSDIFRTNYYTKKRAGNDRERAVKEGLRMVDHEVVRLYATVVPVQQDRILTEYEAWHRLQLAS